MKKEYLSIKNLKILKKSNFEKKETFLVNKNNIIPNMQMIRENNKSSTKKRFIEKKLNFKSFKEEVLSFRENSFNSNFSIYDSLINSEEEFFSDRVNKISKLKKVQSNKEKKVIEDIYKINLQKKVLKKIKKEKIFLNNNENKKIYKENKKIKKKFSCGCKKNKCLRLYCQCFQNSQNCSPFCNCENCLNTPEFSEIKNFVIKKTKFINPSAFESKFKKIKKTDQISNSEKNSNTSKKAEISNISKNGQISNSSKKAQNSDSSKKDKNSQNEKNEEISEYEKIHIRGCKCKKSQCIRNYCECSKMGFKCSVICKCENCLNNKLFIDKKKVLSIFRKTKRKKHKIKIGECFEKDFGFVSFLPFKYKKI